MTSKKLSMKDYMGYYEYEAKTRSMFDTLREISLAENILNEIPKSAASILDVGCGEGYLLFRMRDIYKKSVLYGLDLTEGKVRKTKKNIPKSILLRADGCHIPLMDNSVDIVICSEVLEHIPEYKQIINDIIRVSRKMVIITVPNDQGLTVVRCPICKNKHYFDGHINSFTGERLISLFREKKQINIKKIKKFNTIFSYNRLTMRLPAPLRRAIDQFLVLLHGKITFLKPNFIMAVLEKNR